MVYINLQNMSKYRALIFDLDGTIIDTEKYYRMAWPQAFEEAGYKMTDDQYLFIRSLGRPFVQETLKKFSGDSNFDYEKMVQIRNVYLNRLIEQNGLQTKKGAEELLSFLKANGILTCIATASPEAKARNFLQRTGLLQYFDRIVSARDMKEGKPSPDVYLFAVNQIGLKAEECLAVEDSPNGVLSASRAGLDVIMIPDQAPCDGDTKKIITAEMQDLSQIISLFS